MITDLTFNQPYALWLLFGIPLLIFTHLYFMHHAKKQAITFANFETLQRITGKKILSKNILLLVVRCLIILFLVFAAAGTTVWRIVPNNVNDVVILVDASASMAATDMDGPRIEAAKNSASIFVNRIDTAANIGVVQFSGLPEVLVAPTKNKNDVLQGIANVKIKTVGGTDISAAINTGTNLLATSRAGKNIIIITDGVSSVSLYEENPLENAITYARNNHIVIHTIGIGSQVNAGFLPSLQEQAATFDEQNLGQIANATGGYYAWAKNNAQLEAAYTAIIQQGGTSVEPIELSFGFIFLTILFVFFEWGLANTRYRLLP